MENLYTPLISGSRFLILAVVGTFLLLFSSPVASQQVNISTVGGYIYEQNFNTLPQTGVSTYQNGTTLPGWFISTGNTSLLIADNGSSNTDNNFSYGSTASSDRALGSKIGSKFQLVMKNTTATTIRHFKVTFRMEIWRKGNGNPKALAFSYVQATQINQTTNYTETAVNELQADPISNSNNGAINGNTEFILKTFLIQDINLAAGSSIRFSWTRPDNNPAWGIGIDDVQIEPINALNFYNNNTTALTSLASWGTNTNGSGFAPKTFAGANSTFNITNYPANASLALTTNLNILGTASKIVLGNNTNPVTLSISDTRSIGMSSIDLADFATLSIDANSNPMLNKISTLSTVVLEGNAPSDLVLGDEVGNLVINTATWNAITKKVKVKGILNFKSGKLVLGDNDLELAPGATILNNSGTNYIIVNGKGKLRQSIQAGSAEVVYPVGSVNAYNPVSIKLAAGSTSDIFSIGLLDGVYNSYTNDVANTTSPINFNVVKKTWLVSEDVKGGSNISLTLSWSTGDASQGLNPDNCYLKHYENGVWDTNIPAKATLNGTLYSISRANITSFSPFSVATSSGREEPTILPVTLINFMAKPINNKIVNLNWATATEINNQYFALERSKDGKNFIQIGSVKGAGTTNQRSDYAFTDNTPLAGTSYYRLRQVDIDGTTEYSSIQAVSLSANLTKQNLQVYPNPSQGGTITIKVSELNADQPANLIITDLSGKKIWEQKVQNQDISLEASTFKAGTYLATVISEGGKQTQKIVVQ